MCRWKEDVAFYDSHFGFVSQAHTLGPLKFQLVSEFFSAFLVELFGRMKANL